jgi:pyridoxal phosphate enzyme (YggS family)
MNDRPLIISNRLHEIQKELKAATLIAVTKYSPIEDVVYAYDADQFDFGENRVTDLKEKADYFYEHKFNKVRWHFIGHLQTNKVKELLRIPNLYAIHSVDSLKLCDELIKRRNEIEGTSIKLFLQLNTSHEEEKSGFESLEEITQAIEMLKGIPQFKIEGLMTLGTIRTDDVQSEAKRCFADLKMAKDKLQSLLQIDDLKLSMGMSGDYLIAVEEGSDFVRIGTKIFK